MEEHHEEEKSREVDFLSVILRLWTRKWLLLGWTLAGAVCGLVIAFSIPKEYTTKVKLAPESTNTGRANMGNLGALASMAGFSTGANSSADAVYPQLYPEVVGSIPFSTGLFNVEVRTMDGDSALKLTDYIKRDIKYPWWSGLTSLPSKLFSSDSENKIPEGPHELDNFNLTREEEWLAYVISSRIIADVDQKTNVITINVMMQDPLVSAILADTVVKRLQEYVTAYRTNKARQDLAYVEQLNREAKEQYYAAQQKLADYSDRNQNLVTRSAQITRDRLENEASLAFNLYNQTSQQVQAAKAKVQENTPVFTVISPPTVPMRPTSPRKGLIIGGFSFIGFACCAAWLLFAKPLKTQYKRRISEMSEKPDQPEADNEQE